MIRFSGEKFHRFKTGCGIVALARKSDCTAIARARPRAGRRVAAEWFVDGVLKPFSLGEKGWDEGLEARGAGKESFKRAANKPVR